MASAARSGAAAEAAPEQTLAAYFAAMEAGDGTPDPAIYSPESRTTMSGATPAQMSAVVRTYRDCTAEPARISAFGRHAVIRYPPEQRACAPFFFVRVDGDWLLDFRTMGKAIRFGQGNAWRMPDRIGHPYGFAFEDWRFDANGFPAAGR